MKARTLEIPKEECLELLATQSIGRLSVVVADEPDVFPVNYIFDGTYVVLRSAWGLKVMQAILSRVAFEVDHLDEERCEGWSVVIKGVGEEVTEEFVARSDAERDRILSSWADGAKDRWVRIVPRLVTGRRLIHQSDH